MDIRDRRGLKQYAAQALAGASYPPRKLILIHTGVALGVSLLLTALNYFLTRQIDNTNGLSGLGTRSILATVQSLLQIAGTVFLTFWEFGVLYAALRLARNQHAGPETLPEGLRRFWPLLRLQLLRGVILLGLAFGCTYLGSILYAMTPLSNSMLAILEPLMEQAGTTDPTALIDEATISALIPAMWPVLVIVGVLLCALALPLLYRYRMAEYAILDGEKVGAFASIRISGQLMRGNRLALLRLDLSFWWFYLLELGTLVISYADLLLSLLKVPLAISADALFFLLFFLQAIYQLVIFWFFRPQVETTYAAAFDALRQGAMAPRPIPQPPVPPKQNWDY